MLSIIILTSTDTIVIALENICGILWLIICLRVSTSFVYTLIMSPWGWVSKYLIGRLSICSKILQRRSRIVPWVT